MNSPFSGYTLSNGLRVVVESMTGVTSAAAGILVRTGARDEDASQAGVSHFLEHMCFKGTPKRDCRALSLDFDRIGGHPNAFTSHERTFYHGQARHLDVEKQIELLGDMMESTLPTEEFDREKKVVLEEIAMSQDRIESIAYDLILEKVFAGHPLRWPVLGYRETVGALTRDQMDAYRRSRYVPENMILFVAGRVEPNEIRKLAERYCGHWSGTGFSRKRAAASSHQGTAVKTVDRFQQQIIATCFPAPSAADPDYETAQAAASILGGDNSRFFWEIIQTGLCPQAGAWHLDYSDCGLMILFGQTHPDQVEGLTAAMQEQAARICREKVTEDELQRVKNKRRTGLAVEGESPYHRLVQLMEDVDYRGEPQTVAARLAAVEAVTVDGIADYFRRYPIDRNGYFISVGQRDWPRVETLN